MRSRRRGPPADYGCITNEGDAMRIRRPRRIGGAIAVAATFALIGSACTSDDSIDVVVDDGAGSDEEAMGVALDNAYGSSARTLEGAPYDGLMLEVEYFEPLRKGEWVAPERCTFSTRLTVNGALTSRGFDGPDRDDDREAGDGVLVATIDTFVTDPADPPTTDPLNRVDPGMVSQQPATVALAAVFGHDQVVELSTEHPAALEGHSLEAQPLDGWNVLRVALNPQADLGESIPVTLRRLHEDGTETVEQIDVPVGSTELELLTDDWRFDVAGVDDGCAVPDGSTDNQPAEPDVDVFGSPVGDAPELPQPGTPPSDPAAAADEALRSLRIVYDLSDIWSESKRDHMENPEAYDIIRRELLANDVVAPYMSNLDPEFRSSVFVSPTETHVLYRVGPSYQWSIGRVLLIDGDWRVAAGTFCRDLSAAGYICPNTVNDPPPGPLGNY